MPFLALYYQQLGLSARQIGLLSSISPLVLLLAAPLWGALADATQQYRRILLFAIVGLLVAVFALSQANSLLWLLPALVAYAFFNAPIMPLVDHSVLTLLGERQQEYGRQRVWGAFGWGGMAALAGPIIERWGLAWAFYLCLALMGVNLVAGARLIVSPMHLSTPFRRGAQQLLTNQTMASLLDHALSQWAGDEFYEQLPFFVYESIAGRRKLDGAFAGHCYPKRDSGFLFCRTFTGALGRAHVVDCSAIGPNDPHVCLCCYASTLARLADQSIARLDLFRHVGGSSRPCQCQCPTWSGRNRARSPFKRQHGSSRDDRCACWRLSIRCCWSCGDVWVRWHRRVRWADLL